MKKTIGVLAIIISVLVLANTALASAEKWEIDKAHSNIYFDVKHTFSTVRGLFNDFSGTLLIDTDNPEASSVEFEVKVDSINTNIAKRDEHLRSADFFETKKFPVMTFKSRSVSPVKDNQYIVTGDLTIKDVTKTIDVPFTYFGIIENPMKKGQMIAGFEGKFAINRLDYKVGTGKFADMGVISEGVRIVVTLEAVKN